jgi:DNA helicase II / ATP-dependent DNA helicase PcrA
MNKNSSKYTETFTQALETLNPAQRAAVENIEGPVLVIAGPGTGKTQILATRIGKILQQTDTPAHSILCLTYTDTGRVEMRNRLFNLIGPAAYRVNIHTFHSFCNEVIQDNLSYFGRQNLETISELEEVELFRELLNNLPTDSLLKRFKGDVNYEIPKVKNLFSLIKKEAWSLDFLNERINDYLAELSTKDGFFYKRNYKQFKAGEPNQDRIKEETEYMDKVREAVNLYPTYDAMMRERGRYTFDDMILWVLKAFQENNNILLNYQERYLYFLVDEFQDTSGSQKQLLEHLIKYWDTPNVFVVGDDDQSIFSFQDANVKNIRDFANEYSNGLHKVVLVENYRSTQNILDAAKILIEHNKERIINDDTALNKNLVASRPSLKNLNIPPQIIEYPNPANEAICIVHKIEELISVEKIKPSEIAVIYRNHKQVEELSGYLEKKNIGLNMKRNINLLELTFVHKILTILEFIAAEIDVAYSGDEMLFEILHFDFFKISAIDIARLSLQVAQKNYGNRSERTSIRRAISEDGGSSKPDLFSTEEISEIKRASNVLENLIKASPNLTLQGLFEEVVREAGILNYILNSPEKPWLMQVITGLFDFVKGETRKDPSISLQRLLDMIETMRNNRIRLDLVKVSSTADGVNLVTAHGSKGTEYEYVFIIGCNKNTWDDKKSSGQFEFRLPDNLSDDKYVVDELEEARRLFYVAMTRAKTHLSISYSVLDNENKNKVLERSAFVGEIIEGAAITEKKEKAEESTLIEYLELQYTAKAAPKIELVDKSYLDSLLENYSLSVTHLNNYLDCPIKFYYQNLIKVPAAKGESMAFGSAVHSTLQALFEKMKANGNIFPPKEIMLDDFQRFMYRNRESFTKEQYNRRLEYGGKILPSYYDFYINKWNKIVILEKNIRNVEVEGVPLNGKLDKLEFEGKKVNVVDYKTGSYLYAKKKLKGPIGDDTIGGDYWRQAVFYKILLDNQKYNDWDAVSAEFDFIEPVKDEYKSEKIVISKEDINIVLDQIVDTWQKIQNHEFSKGCNKEDCHWCRFVKENHLQVALHEVTDEE